jgi:predicted amidophosphoribosyltransferase
MDSTERLTPCCKAVAEYTEGVLCCQVCFEEVSHHDMSVLHPIAFEGKPSPAIPARKRVTNA